MPAAITSAAPRPERDNTRARSRRSSSGAGGSGASAGVGRSDWRHSRPPPAATNAVVPTMASENHSPRARAVSSRLSTMKPMPSATSIAARPWRGRRAGLASPPSAGTTSQAIP